MEMTRGMEKRSAASRQAARRNVHQADGQSIPRARAFCERWLGVAAVAVGWALAIADIATIHAVGAMATFELTAFAALAFGFGAGWCARGGRR